MEWTEVSNHKRKKGDNCSNVSSDDEINLQVTGEKKIKINPASNESAAQGNNLSSNSVNGNLKTQADGGKKTKENPVSYGTGEKMKPIVVQESYEVVMNTVSSLTLKSRPVFKVKTKSITQVVCDNLVDKKKITDALKVKQIHFHTFSEPTERSQTFVLKGFYEISCDELTEILKNSGLPVSKVTNPFKNEVRYVYLVHFLPSSFMNIGILNHAHRQIEHLIVKWENLKKAGKPPLQCYNCQRFGHSSYNCGFPYRCIKCDSSHQPGECDRKDPSIGLPVCVNCKGNHAANFKLCPAAVEFKAHTQTAKEPAQKLQGRLEGPAIRKGAKQQPALESLNEFPLLQSSSQHPPNVSVNSGPTFANQVKGKGVSLSLNSHQSLASGFVRAQGIYEGNPLVRESLDLFFGLLEELNKCDTRAKCMSVLHSHLIAAIPDHD